MSVFADSFEKLYELGKDSLRNKDIEHQNDRDLGNTREQICITRVDLYSEKQVDMQFHNCNI